MSVAFYLTAFVAVVSTALALTNKNAAHGILYLVVSFLSVALVFALLGASFVAALEIIVYAGAIVVVFLFAVMLLGLGPAAQDEERAWLPARAWIGPGILAALLALELAYVLAVSPEHAIVGAAVSPAQVGAALFSRYLLAVELASMLLLAALVGVAHVGRRDARWETGP